MMKAALSPFILFASEKGKKGRDEREEG